MKSLEELNGYSDQEVEYTDERPVGVLFDRATPTNQTLLINENQTHTLPRGIEITDIIDYAAAQVYLTLDFTDIDFDGTVVIDDEGFPVHMTVDNISADVYKIGPLHSVADWITAASATIQLPFRYSGTFDYIATISYFDQFEDAQSVSWTVAATVNAIEYLTAPAPFVYTAKSTQTISTVAIDADTSTFNPVWTLTITPSSTAPITTATSTGTGGSFSFNATTKVITITGNKTQVNSHLSNISVTFSAINPNFNFVFNLSNSLNDTVDVQIQMFKNFEFISDFTVSSTVNAIAVTPVFFNIAMSATTAASATPMKLKTATATLSTSSIMSSSLDGVDFGRMIFTVDYDVGKVVALPFTRVDAEGDVALNATISWGDGTTTLISGTPGWYGKTYSSAGVYTIEIRGTIPRMSFENNFPTNPFTFVNSVSGSYTFGNLTSIKDWISFGSVTQVKEIYIFAEMMSEQISVPVKLQPSLRWLNAIGQICNDPKISNWNTSNLTNMTQMFNAARAFNQPLNSWNVSNVTDMQGMFDSGALASAFNQPLNNWDVSNVTNMNYMFRGAENFNQNLSGWCVTNIPSEPIGFATEGCPLTPANKPVWGTCP